MRTEIETLRAALKDAATSLETISRLAGVNEYMQQMSEVRAYASSRAAIARSALAANQKGTA